LDQVMYYGKLISKSAVLADKQRFMMRWPERTYTIDQATLLTSCDDAKRECRLSGLADWRTANAVHATSARGRARFEYTISMPAEVPKIASETSKVVERARDIVTSAVQPTNRPASMHSMTPLPSIDSIKAGCAPKTNTARILTSPNPNDVHPDWRGEGYIGLSWSLRPKRYVKSNTGTYLEGELVSPRGGTWSDSVFVLLDEWQCIST